MSDTRWILPYLEALKGVAIPDEPVDWVCVSDNEIIMVKLKGER